MTEYSERDLILPALDIINRKPGIATSDLIVELEDVLAPDGEDLIILAGRSDTKFSQKVRNLVSHHTIDQRGLGYVNSEQQGRNWYHTITSKGEDYLYANFDQLPKQSKHEDDVEGIDGSLQSPDFRKGEEFSASGYPIDSILIRYEQRTVFEIMRRITSGTYILDPDFQREFVWDETKQSRLIESVLMRIPLPVFYLAERGDGKIVVVDGLQRLMTFNRYLGGGLALRLPESREDLNGKKYEQLPHRLQQRIEDTQLIVYLIDPKVPERIRLDIFERVNSGVPLSRQQMRNSIYMGEATRWLKREANSQEFLKATGGSLSWKTMRDRELINRYCAFTLFKDIELEYRGDMDDFLAETLEKMNKMKPSQLDEMSDSFRRSMVNNYLVFGKHAFRRHSHDDASRSVINAALFDVFSVLMSRHETAYIEERVSEIKKRFYSLMANEDFSMSITLSTNSVRNVVQRFRIATEIFQGL